MGLLAAALFPSSSATSSLAAGLVARGLPLDAAAQVIAGANIETTIAKTWSA